jgi:hypothetical protein
MSNLTEIEKGETGEKQIKSMLIIFSGFKEIVHKEFVLAGQTVNSTYYCDVLRRLRQNVGRFSSEIWRQKNRLFHHDIASSHTSFFTREFLTKDNMTVVFHPLYFLFLRLKMRLKGRHFGTIEAESHAVLNTLTEHDFQDTSKKLQKRWEWCIHAEGDYFKGDCGQ